MRAPILSRYIDLEVLNHIANRRVEPRGLVIGNLAGAHKSPLAGFAVEFAGHREYVPGDDPKHIDWRVYFNRDKLFVKQYELETNFVCHLVIDISASMRYGEGNEQKLAFATRIAATLGYAILKQSDKVSLATFDDRIRHFVPPSNSLGQIAGMSQQLDEVQAVETSDLGTSLNDLAGRFGRREIVLIFSDLFGDLAGVESAIQRLRYNRHEIVLFHVLHHDELHFNFDRSIKFVGLEGAEELMTHPEDLRQGYLQAIGRYRNEVVEMAARNRCEYQLVDTRRPMVDIVIDYLEQRGQSAAR